MKQTQRRRDKHSTEFGLWLRDQKEINSYLGYNTSNVDFMWMNERMQQWLFIEEKRSLAKLPPAQRRIFEKLDQSISGSGYLGLHILIFERTNPDDGRMILDGREIYRDELIEFLMFEKPLHWYDTPDLTPFTKTHKYDKYILGPRSQVERRLSAKQRNAGSNPAAVSNKII